MSDVLETYHCCECDNKDEFDSLDDAYLNGWFRHDYADHCPDHAMDAINECDNECDNEISNDEYVKEYYNSNIITWDDKSFGPCEIVNKVIDVLNPSINKVIIDELEYFLQNIAYSAPEVRDAIFWGTTTVNFNTNFTNICEKYFKNNFKVFNIYQSAVDKYKKDGFNN